MSLPANLINLSTNPSFETSASSYATIWTNQCLNPNFERGITGVTNANGTGGTSTVVQGSATPIPAHSGTFFAKQTWTVATTAVTGGMDFSSISPGTGLLYVSAWVQVSGITQQRLQWSFTGTATITTVTNNAVQVTAGTRWVQMEAFLNVTVAGTVIPHMYAVAGTGGTNWAVSSSLVLDDMMLVNGSGASIPAFSGDSFSADGVQFVWSGTAGASTSLWQAQTPTGVTASGSSTVYNDNVQTMFGGSFEQYRNLTIRSSGAASPGAALGSFTVPSGTVITVAVWVIFDIGMATFPVKLSTTGGLVATGTPVTPVAGTWTQVKVTGTTTSASAVVPTLSITGTPVKGHVYHADAQLWIAGTSTTYFDGNFAPDSSYRYFWTGTDGASTSQAEYKGVWVEQSGLLGAPSVQVYASGLGLTAGLVTITRTADQETWTVPGWDSRNVVDSDTLTDTACPLGRPVVYTLFFNGVQQNQMTITVASTTGWVQDPYDPSSAMPVNTVLTDRSILTLADGSLKTRTHTTNATRLTVMGAKRPYSIAGQRQADGGAILILNAWQNDTSDQFKTLVEGAPILLFRGLPSWGSIPGLAYMDAPAQESTDNRYRLAGNNALTVWTFSGDLVMPVSRQPVTGLVTNDQVQTNLNGVTNAAILARSGSKRNIEIKANPLSL